MLRFSRIPCSEKHFGRHLQIEFRRSLSNVDQWGMLGKDFRRLFIENRALKWFTAPLILPTRFSLFNVSTKLRKHKVFSLKHKRDFNLKNGNCCGKHQKYSMRFSRRYRQNFWRSKVQKIQRGHTSFQEFQEACEPCRRNLTINRDQQ